METRLYVGNLSDDVSAAQLRERFAESGVVTDVQIAFDKSSGRMRGYAFVTMATPADAKNAIAKLDGAMLEDRRLRVNVAGEERERSRSKNDDDGRQVRITSQFRERINMAYELDCNGAALAFKMYPTETSSGGEQWRIDVSANGDAATVLVSATAPTRALALTEVARLWSEKADASLVAHVDWPAVTKAFLGVRAI